jgi:hypothetical protein
VRLAGDNSSQAGFAAPVCCTNGLTVPIMIADLALLGAAEMQP